jgi:hypothetical protein
MKIIKLNDIATLDEINYKLYNYFIVDIITSYNYFKSTYKNNELSKYFNQYINIPNKSFNIIKKLNISSKEPILFINKLNNIKNKQKNLILSNTNILNLLNNVKYNTDLLLSFNSLLKNNNDKIKQLSEEKLINNIIGTYEQYNQELFNSTELDNKYDNITLSLVISSNFIYYSIYHYTLTFYILYKTCFALKCLKSGGNLLIKLPLFKNNTVFAKLMQFLYSKFDKLNVTYEKEFFYVNEVYLDLRGFKGLSSAEYNLLVKTGNEALKYKLDLADILNYKYYHDTVECAGNKPGKMYFKFNKAPGLKVEKPENKLNIITDIEDFSEPGTFVNGIIKTVEHYYDLYIDEQKYNISRLLDDKGQIVDKQQFTEYSNSLMYPYIESLIKKLEENKIPYNKSYLKVIDKYYEDSIEKLFPLENRQTLTLVKYSVDTKKLVINPKLQPYHISDKMDTIIDKLDNQLFVKKQLLDKLGLSKEPQNVKSLFEGLTRGVARYITENFKMQHKVSNGFVKLWEIYNSDPRILPVLSNENINVFHMAEAPGQWIHATDHYIYNTLVANKDAREVKYNWYANALNPYNPRNIALYGTGIFKDDYGFIGKYQERWLYGADKTGDLTRSSTIKWMRDFLHEKYGEDKPIGPLKLVTGDAGINSDAPLSLIQRIDLAQAVTVLACSMKGGNCIIKHFLPYIAGYSESRNATAFYVNIMYLYYSCFKTVRFIKPKTSSPVSGEFYVVGMDFQGVDDADLLRLYNHLDNMKANECFIKKADLPERFVKQVMQFFITLNEFNIEQKELRMDLLNCAIELKEHFKKQKTLNKGKQPDSDYIKQMNCRNYTNSHWIKQFIGDKVEAWVSENNFK